MDDMVSKFIAAFDSSAVADSRVFIYARSSLLHFNDLGNGFQQQDAEDSRAERLSSRAAGIPLRRVK